MSNIIIYSEPVHQGKTSRLLKLTQKYRCSGFLSPDINGIRHLMLLPQHDLIAFETTDRTKKNLTPVGKYFFKEDTFAISRQLISELVPVNNGLIIIDEIGKLELKEKGFEPSLSAFVEKIKSDHTNCKVILVVRDFLLQEVIEKYGLQTAKVVDHNWIENA